MKIVMAATPEQGAYIHKLVDYIYCSLFPNYFTDEEIKQFEAFKILEIDSNNEQLSILKNAFEVISSLQTIISIIESVNDYNTKYKNMFNRNIELLEKYGVEFPFSFEQFTSSINGERLSQYAKPANDYLI